MIDIYIYVSVQATQQLLRQSKTVSSKSSVQVIDIDAREPASCSQTNQDQGYGSSQEFPNSQGAVKNSQGGNSNSQEIYSYSQGGNNNSQAGNSNSQEKHSYSQGRNINSQGDSNEGAKSSSQSGANGNDGVRSTQTKYSPAEIERKKQLALQKRLQRQNINS